MPAATARLVELTRESGGRVVATGTTVTRALESAVARRRRRGVVRAGPSGSSLRPTRREVVTGLITGWHDAAASHLLLVEAVAGPGSPRRRTTQPSPSGYRWHEFGDSGLFLP